MRTEKTIVSGGKHYIYGLYYPESMGGRCFYIGKGTGNRIYEHEQEAKGQRKEQNTYKCRVIRKIWANSEQVQRRKLAHFYEEEDAFQYEIALIFFMEGLTNLTSGGDRVKLSPDSIQKRVATLKASYASGRCVPYWKGKHFSEEHCRAISEGQKGKVVSDDARQKIREKATGRKLSEEARHKVSEALKRRIPSEKQRSKTIEYNKNRIFSEETRKKIGEANRRRVITEETRQKLRQNNKGRTSGPVSEETRRKMSEKAKARFASAETITIEVCCSHCQQCFTYTRRGPGNRRIASYCSGRCQKAAYVRRIKGREGDGK